MQFESVIKRITKITGVYEYEDKLGYVFNNLLSSNRFDEAELLFRHSNIIKDEEELEKISWHILSYKTAC